MTLTIQLDDTTRIRRADSLNVVIEEHREGGINRKTGEGRTFGCAISSCDVTGCDVPCCLQAALGWDVSGFHAGQSMTELSDEQITRACAKVMGYRDIDGDAAWREDDEFGWPYLAIEIEESQWRMYAPLNDASQAFELIERFLIDVNFIRATHEWNAEICQSHNREVCLADQYDPGLKRAICLAVAEMEGSTQ